MSNNQKAYLVVPKLIPQPTWGGEYIASFKGLTDRKQAAQVKLGQSYELGASSCLLDLTGLQNEPDFEDLHDTKLCPAFFEIAGRLDAEADTVRLVDLLRDDPTGFLGKKVVSKYGPVMPLLIKFTQALGNSFQLHIRQSEQKKNSLAQVEQNPAITQEQLGSWLAKPETWYFFERGYVTLGLRPGADIGKYREVCEEIADYMQDLSQRVKSDLLLLKKARQMAKNFVEQKDPWQFVNLLYIDADQVVDPSAGGIHHSWEQDDQKCPQGNIVYEVQLDRPDHLSTIRSFDKGKIKDDGSIRQIQVHDYFKYLDSSLESNDLAKLVKRPELLKQEGSGKIERLFATEHYACERVCLTDQMSLYQDETRDSFLHVFVKKGKIEICTQSEGGSFAIVEQGWSVLFPAGFGRYTIGIVGGKPAEVLKTWVRI